LKRRVLEEKCRLAGESLNEQRFLNRVRKFDSCRGHPLTGSQIRAKSLLTGRFDDQAVAHSVLF
jgi:hypothetical protein